MGAKDIVRHFVLPRLMRATRFERQGGPLEGVLNEWTLFAEEPTNCCSEELLDLATELIAATRLVPADGLGGRCSDLQVDRWPGEHYRLLTAACDVIRPRVAVDIGTATGLSSLAMLRSPAVGKVVTFDIGPWRALRFGGATTFLRDSDFDSRFTQEIADLADELQFEFYAETLRAAELIFVDGPKAGEFERAFFTRLFASPPTVRQLVIVDDIRVMTMVKLWRELPSPRLDFSSFGHFSGTGLLLRRPLAA